MTKRALQDLNAWYLAVCQLESPRDLEVCRLAPRVEASWTETMELFEETKIEVSPRYRLRWGNQLIHIRYLWHNDQQPQRWIRDLLIRAWSSISRYDFEQKAQRLLASIFDSGHGSTTYRGKEILAFFVPIVRHMEREEKWERQDLVFVYLSTTWMGWFDEIWTFARCLY